jgi:peptide/nickel transport system permease protein
VPRQLARKLKRFNSFTRRYAKNPAACLGFAVLLSFVVLALIGPIIAPYDPYEIVWGPFEPPNSAFLMGTDNIGRDVASGVLRGIGITLMIGSLAAATGVGIGILIGCFAGYTGGVVDDVLMRFGDVIMTLPSFVLALVFVALFGASVWNIIIVIGVLFWTRTARIVRAEFLSIKEREYVTAAKALGKTNLRIMFGDILPNALPPTIVVGSLEVATAVLYESSLSFLGLGDPKMMSLGFMLYAAQSYLRRAYWMMLFPGLSILLIVLAVNLVGDGLNDALNPKLREYNVEA